VPVLLCDPRSPWQRGTNENTNGLLHQYLPRSSASPNDHRSSSTRLPPSSTDAVDRRSDGSHHHKHSTSCCDDRRSPPGILCARRVTDPAFGANGRSHLARDAFGYTVRWARAARRTPIPAQAGSPWCCPVRRQQRSWALQASRRQLQTDARYLGCP
jgi:hypothetical protein